MVGIYSTINNECTYKLEYKIEVEQLHITAYIQHLIKLLH